MYSVTSRHPYGRLTMRKSMFGLVNCILKLKHFEIATCTASRHDSEYVKAFSPTAFLSPVRYTYPYISIHIYTYLYISIIHMWHQVIYTYDIYSPYLTSCHEYISCIVDSAYFDPPEKLSKNFPCTFVISLFVNNVTYSKKNLKSRVYLKNPPPPRLTLVIKQWYKFKNFNGEILNIEHYLQAWWW